MAAADPDRILSALNWRYATKEFDATRAIPAETWDALLSALVLTPSSFGLQPWRFLVIEDPGLRERLRIHSWDQPQVTDASRFLVLTARTAIDDADIDRWIDHLAAARKSPPEKFARLRSMISSFVASLDADERRNWCVRQVYLALGQLMTSAAMLGIDTCPLEGLDPEAYDRELGLAGTGFTTAVACALGYRSATDNYAGQPKIRYPREEVVRTL